jgi:hypothetical protein
MSAETKRLEVSHDSSMKAFDAMYQSSRQTTIPLVELSSALVVHTFVQYGYAHIDATDSAERQLSRKTVHSEIIL